uniref:Fatty acid hydroxylase n=1 Tax=Phaselicystis flava TaxID=525924 RepID=A0A3S5GYF6_9BACT|nr:fatty acid hydroxylase [Phaselicystis flava]
MALAEVTQTSASGFDGTLLLSYLGLSIAGGLVMYFGVGGMFEWLYYRRRRHDPSSWKCQPTRWPGPKTRRSEIRLGTLNMTAAGALSGLFVYHVATGGRTGVYFDLRTHGLAFTVASALIYFLATDYLLYWAHRLFHRPRLYRLIHRVHHRYGSPTAFAAAAMHPVEFLTYQSVMLVPLFVYPIHAVALAASLVYLNWVALVDHSGIRLHAWFPWQPPATFHDDHHLHFHVNFGQTLGAWDRLHGTWRRADRKYGVEVFGGKGAPSGGGAGEPTSAPPPYIDYGRSAQDGAKPAAEVEAT